MSNANNIPELNELVSQDLENAIKEGVQLCSDMKEIKITSQEEYDNTTDFLKDVKKSIKLLDDNRKAIGDPYRLKAKEVNDHFTPTINDLKSGEKVLKNAMGVFFQEQERIRLEAEREAQRKADEAERKLQEQAEKELEKAEQYREEGREDLAEKAEIRAENKVFESQNVVAEAVQDTTKKAGVSFVEDYEVTIVDEEKAIKALLSGSLSYIVKIDEAELKKAYKLTKGKMKIDGVNCRTTKSVRMRS